MRIKESYINDIQDGILSLTKLKQSLKINRHTDCFDAAFI